MIAVGVPPGGLNTIVDAAVKPDPLIWTGTEKLYSGALFGFTDDREAAHALIVSKGEGAPVVGAKRGVPAVWPSGLVVWSPPGCAIQDAKVAVVTMVDKFVCGNPLSTLEGSDAGG